MDPISELFSISKEEIARKISNATRNSSNFKRLKSILRSFVDAKKLAVNQVIVFIITEEALKSLNDEADIDAFINNTHISIQLNDVIYLTQDLDIHACERFSNVFPGNTGDNNEVRRYLIDISLTSKCVVFHVSPSTIHDFTEGTDSGNAIFYSETTLKKYEKKRDISELDAVLEEYRVHLTDRNTYTKFFVPKTTFTAWFRKDPKNRSYSITTSQYKQFLSTNKHILRNKPEDIFREDLRAFLRDKIRNGFNISKEYILKSFKRLDIYTEDENGNFYFLEIKWIGTSNMPDDSGPGTKYDNRDINPAAFTQTLEYIEELDRLQVSVKLGYLIVFDARPAGAADPTYQGNTGITQSLHPYLGRFKRYAHFIVKNDNPN